MVPGWKSPCLSCPPNSVTSDSHDACICSHGYYKILLSSPAHLTASELSSTPAEGLAAVSFQCSACLANALCQDNLIANDRGAWVFVDAKVGGVATVYACPDGTCLPNNTCAAGRKPDFRSNILCGECLPDYSEWSGTW